MSENNQNCRLCGSKALKNKGNGLLICKTCGLENHVKKPYYTSPLYFKKRDLRTFIQKIPSINSLK